MGAAVEDGDGVGADQVVIQDIHMTGSAGVSHSPGAWNGSKQQRKARQEQGDDATGNE